MTRFTLQFSDLDKQLRNMSEAIATLERNVANPFFAAVLDGNPTEGDTTTNSNKGPTNAFTEAASKAEKHNSQENDSQASEALKSIPLNHDDHSVHTKLFYLNRQTDKNSQLLNTINDLVNDLSSWKSNMSKEVQDKLDCETYDNDIAETQELLATLQQDSAISSSKLLTIQKQVDNLISHQYQQSQTDKLRKSANNSPEHSNRGTPLNRMTSHQRDKSSFSKAAGSFLSPGGSDERGHRSPEHSEHSPAMSATGSHSFTTREVQSLKKIIGHVPEIDDGLQKAMTENKEMAAQLHDVKMTSDSLLDMSRQLRGIQEFMSKATEFWESDMAGVKEQIDKSEVSTKSHFNAKIEAMKEEIQNIRSEEIESLKDRMDEIKERAQQSMNLVQDSRKSFKVAIGALKTAHTSDGNSLLGNLVKISPSGDIVPKTSADQKEEMMSKLNNEQLRKELEKVHREVRWKLKDFRKYLEQKVSHIDLKPMEVKLNRIEKEMTHLSTQVPSKKALNFFERKIREMLEFHNDALLSKKPLAGWSCGSCQKEIHHFKDRKNDRTERNKISVNRAGKGFSRVLLGADEELLKEVADERQKQRVQNFEERRFHHTGRRVVEPTLSLPERALSDLYSMPGVNESLTRSPRDIDESSSSMTKMARTQSSKVIYEEAEKLIQLSEGFNLMAAGANDDVGGGSNTAASMFDSTKDVGLIDP
eukprot:CAMPEP_0115029632 /NCGR_PEP_ID=MMETSP0216-20121206/37145_1 /TAXON_ID=223996 /ORGANISM="Protocruzia adherens, Strain Boccale" /LENGTH=702 /DNA_ID=CAMNT_0002406311 /DNA_START=86 /DNA_END=2192 /DNA_ORIENTATION=-